jgi:hypothetical protein
MKPNAPLLKSPSAAVDPPASYASATVNVSPLLVPSVEELAMHLSGEREHPMLVTPSPYPRESKSLLRGLLGGNVDVLIDDYEREPTRYSPEVGELLSCFGGRAPGPLTPAEERMLNTAVLEFAAAPKPAAPAAMKTKVARKAPVLQTGESIERGRPWEDAAPGVTPELYWWMK